MIGLDTSVVVRLLVGEPAELANRAQAFLDEVAAAGEEICVSDMVVAETYYALQYHYKVPKHEALKALKGMFDFGEVKGTGSASEVLKTRNLSSANPGFIDRLIHLDYQQDGGRMATFEKKSRRLTGTRVL